MADQILARDAVFYYDIPGSSTGPRVTLTVTDPLGQVAYAGELESLGLQRYAQTVTSDKMTTSGLWSDTVQIEGQPATIRHFSVGPYLPASLSLYEIRAQVANRESPVYRSEIYEYEAGMLTDDTLLGGADNYKGNWILLHPNIGVTDAGRARRVRGFSGISLELNRPFLSIPKSGTPYLMMKSSPDEVDSAINLSIVEFAPLSRVPLSVESIPVVLGADGTSTVLTIPDGFTEVSEVWFQGTLLGDDEWVPSPGRQLELTPTSVSLVAGTDAVDLVGTREATMPRWEHSTIDFSPPTFISYASAVLMLARASGEGIDQADHLRRSMVQLDAANQALRRSVGRVPNGAKTVIE